MKRRIAASMPRVRGAKIARCLTGLCVEALAYFDAKRLFDRARSFGVIS